MKLLVVLIIAVVIFVLVYLSSEGDTKKAALFAALAAAIAFAGPYIVNLAEIQEPYIESTQENEHSDDSLTYPDNQNSSNSEDDTSQFEQPENPTSAGESSQTPELEPELELSIDKKAPVKMEVQSIESKLAP